MTELENIFSRLEIIFKATKLNYVIVGGIAVIHYGHVRTTQDIDIIIEDDYSKISQFIRLLKAYEFDVMDDQFKLAYQEKTNISIFDKKSFFRLDIKVYQDVVDFLTLFHANKETIDLTFLNNKAKEIGLKTTLDRLFSIDI